LKVILAILFHGQNHKKLFHFIFVTILNFFLFDFSVFEVC